MVLSGLGTAIIIGTTTLAFTFTGVSILFALLLMRGGVLIIAPTVDLLYQASRALVLLGRTWIDCCRLLLRRFNRRQQLSALLLWQR